MFLLRKSFILIVSIGVGLLGACSANPSAPEIDMNVSDSSSQSTGQGEALTAGQSLFTMGGRPGSKVVVYVRSQGLYYDSIVTADLPRKGRFQKLEMVNARLETDFGPGDPGYLGGRWWLDVNGDTVMDEGDNYFLCPLLGPGRENP